VGRGGRWLGGEPAGRGCRADWILVAAHSDGQSPLTGLRRRGAVYGPPSVGRGGRWLGGEPAGRWCRADFAGKQLPDWDPGRGSRAQRALWRAEQAGSFIFKQLLNVGAA